MNAAPRIYLDHAATTPLRDDVLAAMLPYFTTHGFNASSLHAEGRAARAAIDRARTTVAQLLGAKAREIVFTGGGTEADHLAVRGVFAARQARGVRGGHVVTSATEHAAVLGAVNALRDDGVAVTVLPVDPSGRVRPGDFSASLRGDTLLAAIMLTNNELGTLNAIAELARLAHARGVAFHTDAVQGGGRLPLDVAELEVDMLALSAHKFGGPKGVGALYVREGTALAPLIAGGGQEAGRRAGTENVAGIVGFATAFELAARESVAQAARLGALRDRFEAEVRERIPGVRVNAAGAERAPHISSIAFEGVTAVELVVALDLAGIAVSAGSACASGAAEPSHVLAAIGAPAWALRGTIRFSFGKLTSKMDVERVLRTLPGIVDSLRVATPVLGTSHSGSSSGRSEVRS